MSAENGSPWHCPICAGRLDGKAGPATSTILVSRYDRVPSRRVTGSVRCPWGLTADSITASRWRRTDARRFLSPPGSRGRPSHLERVTVMCRVGRWRRNGLWNDGLVSDNSAIAYRADLLFIDYAEAANKRTDIQNMIKAVNIKKTTLKNLYNRCSKCLPHRLLDKRFRVI